MARSGGKLQLIGAILVFGAGALAPGALRGLSFPANAYADDAPDFPHGGDEPPPPPPVEPPPSADAVPPPPAPLDSIGAQAVPLPVMPDAVQQAQQPPAANPGTPAPNGTAPSTLGTDTDKAQTQQPPAAKESSPGGDQLLSPAAPATGTGLKEQADIPQEAMPAPPPTETAASSEPPAQESAGEDDSSVFKEADLRNPRFHRIKPNWAFGISASPSGLGGSTFSNGVESTIVRGILLEGEYQPAVLQKFGIIGFGPVAAFYPVVPRYNNILTAGGVWSVGAQARYQAYYFKQQPIVPFVGIATERVAYHLSDASPESLFAAGPILGANLMLNWLEPSSAFEFYSNYGVVRSYLTAELRVLSGSSSDQTISGTSYFFGLRIEF